MMHEANKHVIRRAYLAWLLPVLALSPLMLAAKGCSNAGVVGDDCPPDETCASGTAGTKGDTPNDKTCGGITGAACAKGQYCSFPESTQCGSGDQTGTCLAKPMACDLIYAPVCGCDGKTYGNDCAAASAGVSVAEQGECETRPDPPEDKGCGGLQGLDCADDEYCNFPPSAQCGAADQTGRCEPKPEGCNKILAPVCGCDDTTYGNACMAAMAGVSVAAVGECDTGEVTACGARAGDTCAKDEYCAFAPDAICGRADATGTCAPRPDACDAVYAPVCGCDGKTYGNACEAASAGVSTDHAGACAKVCGGLLGEQCDGGSFCDFADMSCGNADIQGRCVVIPEVCTDDVDPVCGCDGKTYSNDCSAHSKGVSVASKGACK
jgi:Kazal-type serine protease inhibitor domain